MTPSSDATSPDGFTPDERLATAFAGPDDDASLEFDDLIRLTGAPRVLLEAAEREGLLIPHHTWEGRSRYTSADVEALRAGLSLLERGLPFPELVLLGRIADAALDRVAEAAAEAFHRFVRDPAVASEDPDDAAARLVDAYRVMLPAAVIVVAHRLRRHLVSAAAARLEAATGSQD